MIYAVLGVAVAIALLAGAFILLRKRFRTARKEVELLYPEHTRLLTAPMANFFGLRSLGMKQVRGNGILLLTEDRLYFRMLLPKREITIPLSGVTSISTPSSFLGKTRGMQLLQVDFHGAGAGEDSAAWLVGDLEAWTSRIASLAGIAVMDSRRPD